MPERLHPRCLDRLPKQVARPGYDRAQHEVGIVHLGLGAFHRAHQAAYVDEALARRGGDWRILGVSLRSPAVRRQLKPQDGLYTLVERASAGDRMRIIGSIADALVAPENPAAVIDAMAQPSTHIVSLTITEKGYRRAADGGLDLAHPDITHDLKHPERSRSAIGLVTEALHRRWSRGLPALTLVCCDNLPHNGAVLKRLLLEFASARHAPLAAWTEREVACPSTMVDRIVPATTRDDLDAFEAKLGVRDEGAVKTEPFTQWVIEDRFVGERPAFEEVGALLVRDVRPFEIAKLRLLNGSHSTLAYLGHVAGFTYVHEAISDPELRAIVDRLMSEASATLDPIPGLDLASYRTALLERFANRALSHRLLQIAMDGSQKLPQRLLAPLSVRLQRGESADALILAVAAWMRFLTGRDERGGTHAIDDPLAPRLAQIARSAADDAQALVDGLLGIEDIFGRELPTNAALRTQLKTCLESLLRDGVRTTVHRLLSQRAPR